MRIVLTICCDPDRLRCAACPEPDGADLGRYAMALRDLLRREFGAIVHVRLGDALRVECDDTGLGESIHGRVADIQASESGEWIRLAFGGGA